MNLKEAIKCGIDLIYPRCCPVCANIVVPRGDTVCHTCKDILIKISEPRCKKCSKPIENEEKEYCYDCSNKKFQYIKGYSLWLYDEAMKRSISGYKFAGKKEYVDYYIYEIINEYGEVIKKIKPDALIPIPIHKSKLNQRGFNQAELLAKGISKGLGIPMLSKLLIRYKKTLPQKGLNDKERFENLRQAFKLSDRKMKNHNWDEIKRIVLIDDIYTTGSTIEACTEVLNGAGIKEVYFLSVCIGKGF